MTQDPGSAAQMSERMQSLLSRAVEDQLSEQRQLAGAVAELRAQVAALTHQLSTLGSGSTSDLESAVAGIAGDIREAVRLLAERTDGVGRLVQQRGHDLAEIRASIAELTQAMQQHTAAVDGMTGGLKALPAFGQRIETLQGGLDRLHERLRGLEEITASVQGMQQKVDNLDGGVRELRHAFTGVAARAAELPSRTDIEAVVLRGAGPLDSLGNRLGRIETTLPSMLERLDTLAESLGAHGQRLDEVGANIGELLDDDPDSGKLSPEAEQELTVIRARLDELHERTEGGGLVDELVSKIDSLHEALLGEDGVQAQLDALIEPEDEPGESLEDVVARAVADTERRLTQRIDEAALALAELLVRRRSSRAASRAEILSSTPPPAAAAAPAAQPAAPAPPSPPSPAAPVVDDDPDVGLDDADFEVPIGEPRPPAAPAKAAPAKAAAAAPAKAAPAAAASAKAAPAAAAKAVPAKAAPAKAAASAGPASDAPAGLPVWQTPAPKTSDEPAAAADADGDAAEGRKRRPWWRPGD